MYDAIWIEHEHQIGIDLTHYDYLSDAAKAEVTRAVFDGQPYTTSSSLAIAFEQEVAIQ